MGGVSSRQVEMHIFFSLEWEGQEMQFLSLTGMGLVTHVEEHVESSLAWNRSGQHVEIHFISSLAWERFGKRMLRYTLSPR
jgi:hypothetical protein